MIVLRQEVAQFTKRAQVNIAFRDQAENHREAAYESGCGHSSKSLTFAQGQAPQAVVEQRRAADLEVKPSFLDFGEVGDHTSDCEPLTTDDELQALEQLVVRKPLEIPFPSVHRSFIPCWFHSS
ncbi:MAG TPA: hypothetical protein VM686_32385 [Polyangiaceae bacterium]|nr:hypothetical protein [Polyangiaceae bacterium]